MYPEIFHISFLHTYGALVALAFLAGLWMAALLAKRDSLDVDAITNLGIYCALAAIVGVVWSVTLGGIGPAPVRATEVERALIGEAMEEKRLREICESLRTLDAIEDVHAPSSYRQQLATVLPRRALLKA